MDSQIRVLNHLLESMRTFLDGLGSLEGVQLDLEANLGVIDACEIRSAVSIVANKLDECIHIYDEHEGDSYARKMVSDLAKRIERYLKDFS